MVKLKREIIYYTDNLPSEKFLWIIRNQIMKACGDIPIISVSQWPIPFGRNIVLPGIGRSDLSLYKQILIGLETSNADVVYFAEHDVIYHPSHFDCIPPDNSAFWYDTNIWKVRAKDGQALYYQTYALSLMVCYRDIAVEHYRERVRLETIHQIPKATHYEPGRFLAPKGMGTIPAKYFRSEHPCIDIKHENNWNGKCRFNKSSFRSLKSIRDWQLADDVPFWGKTKGRFNQFLEDIDNGKT